MSAPQFAFCIPYGERNSQISNFRVSANGGARLSIGEPKPLRFSSYVGIG